MPHNEWCNTPPLGWNSWDCYGAAVTEDEVRGNADYMAQHLKAYGWEYVVVDIQWYEPDAVSSSYRPFVPLVMDEYSRLQPAPNRFPSAANGQGFKPLADYVHGLGLKFGIHIMRGIPRQAVHANTALLGTEQRAREIAHTNSICPWNTDMYGVDANQPGAQAYYDSLFALYAEWGVDYVKVDDIAASRLYGIHTDEIRMIREAIDKCGRKMVLSLSPGPAPRDETELLAANANMWRMTDDYWDRWELLLDMFDRCKTWEGVPGPGCWPDCDMLPLGHIGIRSVDGGVSSKTHDRWTRFTRDEQLTMMTLWTIFRSPLMFGGELRDNDEWTLSLLTNRHVLEMHRHSFGARQLYRDAEAIVWTAKGPEGVRYVACFNVGETPMAVSVPLEQLALGYGVLALALWEVDGAEQAISELAPVVAPHGAALYRLRGL